MTRAIKKNATIPEKVNFLLKKGVQMTAPFSVEIGDEVNPEKMKVLGYRYDDILILINEDNLTWNDRYLVTLSLESLFSEPIEVIAGQKKIRYSQS